MRAIAEELVAIGPRPDSTARAQAATELIATRLAALGLEVRREVIGSVRVPRVAVGSWQISPRRLRNSTNENIWVRFGGEGPARLLLAHYDTVPGSPGAVDNAAAVAILLEIAGCFSRELPSGPVVVAFTGAEEVGLVGARKLAETLSGTLELAISLDLIGHQVPLALNGLSATWSRGRLRWLADRVEASETDAYVPLFHRLISRKLPQLERSDHGAIASTGVPAVHLYGRGDDRIYLRYHSAFDTMDQVDDGAIENALALTFEIATAHDALPPEGDDVGVWLTTPMGPFVVSSFAALAAEIVLAIGAALLVMLCWARRRRAIRARAIGVLGVFLMFVVAFLAVAVVMEVTHLIHGNSMAGAHEPTRFIVASLAIAAAAGGLITIIANRWAFFIRGTRYHSYASFIALLFGVGLLGMGAVELAWLPLLISALLALAGFQLERPIVCSLATGAAVLLTLPLLSPAFLREAIFHGFFPKSLPLAAYLAFVSLPSWLGIFGALRARLEAPSRSVMIALVIALVGAFGVAAAIIIVPAPACSAAAANAFGLSCEVAEIAAQLNQK